jgi:hypothetical protein
MSLEGVRVRERVWNVERVILIVLPAEFRLPVRQFAARELR